MPKQRNRTRAARRRAERTRLNLETRERGAEAVATAEDAKSRPRNARHAAQLDVLLHRGIVSTDQARAGNRFAGDFRRSGSVIGNLISRYEAGMPRPPKKYSAPPPDVPHVIEARERFEAAQAALGPLAPIAIHTCISRFASLSLGCQRQAQRRRCRDTKAGLKRAGFALQQD